ncbi:hypothetical protein BG011_008266 [Mortierella polycephala]|uniref:Cytochrome P450 n=1 Tax=Mortierella polycephala TaxID=41804 RepID=A0A9P6PRI0_9FUNG|nr:hypothetical protein BG011_008266 [Mortierella polycephala]
MTQSMIWIGLKGLMASQLQKAEKHPLQFLLFGTIALLTGAVIKYPNRAIFCRNRPDLIERGCHVPEYPLLGSLPHLLRAKDPLKLLHWFLEQRGDVATFTFPGMGRVILVNNAKLLEYMLKTNFDNYVKGEFLQSLLSDILGPSSIFLTDGPEWRHHRKTSAGVFSTKFHRSLVQGLFRTNAQDLSQILDHYATTQEPVGLQNQFLKLTLDTIGKSIFGVDFKLLSQPGEVSSEFGDAVDFLTTATDSRAQNPFWRLWDRLIPGRKKKLDKALEVLDKYAVEAVRKRRAETEDEKEARFPDLLDHFVHHRYEDGSLITDRELRDVFINMTVAGRDTTAQALTWQFYAIMANPRIMKNIVKEVDQVLQGSEDRLTYEILNNEMPYAKAVLYETLRLYPAAPKNQKMALEDDILPDGTRVYKGDFIGFSTYCLGRNKSEEMWGENANEFYPERWLVNEDSGCGSSSGSGDETDEDTVPGKSSFGKFRPESPFKFLSFHAGPRACLGKTFATLEVTLTTCLLLQKFKFELVPGHPIPHMRQSLVLAMEEPLMTIVTRREA